MTSVYKNKTKLPNLKQVSYFKLIIESINMKIVLLCYGIWHWSIMKRNTVCYFWETFWTTQYSLWVWELRGHDTISTYQNKHTFGKRGLVSIMKRAWSRLANQEAKCCSPSLMYFSSPRKCEFPTLNHIFYVAYSDFRRILTLVVREVVSSIDL